jgi:hypothetical protein
VASLSVSAVASHGELSVASHGVNVVTSLSITAIASHGEPAVASRSESTVTIATVTITVDSRVVIAVAAMVNWLRPQGHGWG